MSETALRLRDHAYSSFTEKLLAQDIEPGQIITQRELVDLTGLPLGAIREMIPRLEADGLIRTVPKRGLQVLSIDLDLIRNAFQLRRIIEGEAIADFCQTAEDADIARIAEEHAAIRDLAKGGVDAALLDGWVAELGWEGLLNRRGTTWRGLPAEVRDGIDQDSALRLMQESPSIIRRPVLDTGAQRHVGFSEADYQGLLG